MKSTVAILPFRFLSKSGPRENSFNAIISFPFIWTSVNPKEAYVFDPASKDNSQLSHNHLGDFGCQHFPLSLSKCNVFLYELKQFRILLY